MKLRDHDQPCEHGTPYGNHHIIYTRLGGQSVESCPGGREVSVVAVPWCDTHGSPIKDPDDGACEEGWLKSDDGSCRLEEPQSVYRINPEATDG